MPNDPSIRLTAARAHTEKRMHQTRALLHCLEDRLEALALCQRVTMFGVPPDSPRASAAFASLESATRAARAAFSQLSTLENQDKGI